AAEVGCSCVAATGAGPAATACGSPESTVTGRQNTIATSSSSVSRLATPNKNPLAGLLPSSSGNTGYLPSLRLATNPTSAEPSTASPPSAANAPGDVLLSVAASMTASGGCPPAGTAVGTWFGTLVIASASVSPALTMPQAEGGS